MLAANKKANKVLSMRILVFSQYIYFKNNSIKKVKITNIVLTMIKVKKYEEKFHHIWQLK